jgi:hypothetical protein
MKDILSRERSPGRYWKVLEGNTDTGGVGVEDMRVRLARSIVYFDLSFPHCPFSF